MLSDGSKDFVYNAANQLIQVKNKSTQTEIASYEYDAYGRRTKLTTLSGTTYFHYDGMSTWVLYETDANNVVKVSYTYDAGGNRVSMTYNGQTYFYHYNAHGDVTSLTDSTCATVASYDYDAWGGLLSTAPAAGSIGDINLYRYAGYRFDKETGFHYLNSRYYWAVVGRFISRDNYHGSEHVPLSLNLYNYCQSNPVLYTDPTGHKVYYAWRDSTVTLNWFVEFYGPGASWALVDKWVAGVKRYWGIKTKKYNVRVLVTPRIQWGPNPSTAYNAYTKIKVNPPSVNDDGNIEGYFKNGEFWSKDRGTWDTGLSAWGAAHEFGHLLDIYDRYITREKPNPGWGNNIMNVTGGYVWEYDIDYILKKHKVIHQISTPNIPIA